MPLFDTSRTLTRTPYNPNTPPPFGGAYSGPNTSASRANPSVRSTLPLRGTGGGTIPSDYGPRGGNTPGWSGSDPSAPPPPGGVFTSGRETQLNQPRTYAPIVPGSYSGQVTTPDARNTMQTQLINRTAVPRTALGMNRSPYTPPVAKYSTDPIPGGTPPNQFWNPTIGNMQDFGQQSTPLTGNKHPWLPDTWQNSAGQWVYVAPKGTSVEDKLQRDYYASVAGNPNQGNQLKKIYDAYFAPGGSGGPTAPPNSPSGSSNDQLAQFFQSILGSGGSGGANPYAWNPYGFTPWGNMYGWQGGYGGQNPISDYRVNGSYQGASSSANPMQDILGWWLAQQQGQGQTDYSKYFQPVSGF